MGRGQREGAWEEVNEWVQSPVLCLPWQEVGCRKIPGLFYATELPDWGGEHGERMTSGSQSREALVPISGCSPLLAPGANARRSRVWVSGVGATGSPPSLGTLALGCAPRPSHSLQGPGLTFCSLQPCTAFPAWGAAAAAVCEGSRSPWQH
jgi:hypothetical protein